MFKRRPGKIMRTVLFSLVLREVRGRLGSKRMGAFWFVFEPLAHILVMMSIYTFLRHRTLPGFDFPVYLITGIIPFLLFRNIALKGMEAVNANKALFSYRQIMPFDTIVARAIVESALSACVYAIVLAGLGFWFDYDVRIAHPLEWFLTMAVGIVFAFSLALIFCVITEMVPELKTIIRLLFLPLYLLSGVIIPLWLVPRSLLDLMLWNPLLHIIEQLREEAIDHYPHIDEINLEYPAAVSAVTLLCGLALYRARRLKLMAL